MNREQNLITKDVTKDMPHSIDHNSSYFHVGQRLTLTLLKKLNFVLTHFQLPKSKTLFYLVFDFVHVTIVLESFKAIPLYSFM